MTHPEDCCCPPWQPTQCGPDGTPEDYACPDDSCRCTVHCWDEDEDRPMWETLEIEAAIAEGTWGRLGQ